MKKYDTYFDRGFGKRKLKDYIDPNDADAYYTRGRAKDELKRLQRSN